MVKLERSFEDKEDVAIMKFIAESCGCTLGPKISPCSSQLFQDTITLTRKNWLQLFWSDLELVIMGYLNALVADKASAYRRKAERFRPLTKFFLHVLQICRKTFGFVHAVGSLSLHVQEGFSI